MRTTTFFLMLALTPCLVSAQQHKPRWSGQGSHRVLVEVPALDLGPRDSDERPARIELDAAKLSSPGQRVDVDSIQVIRYDPATGEPLPGPKFAFGRSRDDLPFRWYDAAIPDPFPEVEVYADGHTGTFPRQSYPLWGYRYNVVGDWVRGRLAWLHRQQGKAASHYAVYFDSTPADRPIAINPRCAWVGDGSNRCTLPGLGTTGQLHTRIALADWNGDGLIDILAGFHSGALVFYANLGSRTEPKFSVARLVFLDNGLPLENGGQSAPLVVDWDGDGLPDLIVGTEWNRQLFYRNVGARGQPKLRFVGFLEADGKPLQLPHAPCPETEPHYTYQRDYYAVWEACDWDGDGDLDLLGGGYVTGRIYLYENTGKGPDGLPKLRYRGPIEADGGPLDTTWCAAPCVADFDHDGRLDLISGCMLMHKGGDAPAGDLFLRYWQNVGTRTAARLTLRPFPGKGRFPGGALSTPRTADLNGDGLLDLVVSAGSDIYVWPNVGARSQPRFDVSSGPLQTGFGNAQLPGVQMTDVRGDGHLDVVSGFGYFPDLGRGNPGAYGQWTPIVRGPDKIEHPSPHGDPYSYVWFADVDGDRRLDCLFGDHAGRVWLHRQLSPEGKFDRSGVSLQQTDGKPIDVGVKPGERDGFVVLQGARTTLATGDVDRDGRTDLLVGDTYGNVRYYRNAGGSPTPRFEPPVLVGCVRVRCTPCLADWDGDGRLDILASRPGLITLWLNKQDASGIKFVQSEVALPVFPHGSVSVAVLDFNGDGDADILATTAHQYSFFLERSFLERGYAEGRVVATQRRP